jgi:hypothetical protein
MAVKRKMIVRIWSPLRSADWACKKNTRQQTMTKRPAPTQPQKFILFRPKTLIMNLSTVVSQRKEKPFCRPFVSRQLYFLVPKLQFGYLWHQPKTSLPSPWKSKRLLLRKITPHNRPCRRGPSPFSEARLKKSRSQAGPGEGGGPGVFPWFYRITFHHPPSLVFHVGEGGLE